MVPNDEPKSVNIDKISTALHVYYLNLIVNYLNTLSRLSIFTSMKMESPTWVSNFVLQDEADPRTKWIRTP